MPEEREKFPSLRVLKKKSARRSWYQGKWTRVDVKVSQFNRRGRNSVASRIGSGEEKQGRAQTNLHPRPTLEDLLHLVGEYPEDGVADAGIGVLAEEQVAAAIGVGVNGIDDLHARIGVEVLGIGDR